jgi:hypothetical protein
MVLVQNLLEISARESHPVPTPTGRPNPQASQITCLKAQHTKHWQAAGSDMKCQDCTAMNKQNHYQISVHEEQSQNEHSLKFQKLQYKDKFLNLASITK